jgi:predicted Zn-dependent peptidase
MTITISGFSTKEEIIEWLNQYEGGIEQHFDEVPSFCKMEQYIPEMREFESQPEKKNFNLVVH